jgi:hypothetical protein
MFSMWLLERRAGQYGGELLGRAFHSPFQHHQSMRMPTDVWMYSDRIHEPFLVLAVKELESIHPHFFNVAGVYPAVAVGGFFLYRNRQHQTHWSGLKSKPSIHLKGYAGSQRTINIIGGKSSAYQLAGISHNPVVTPASNGFIQWSGCLE